ncbi:MAG: type II secretion system protein, partial [Planctomycetota bacterium]
MSKSKGFTLIELLVVISIIALLMAILMPTLSKAKELATETACLSNLKQWGVVYNMFFADNDSRFPKQGFIWDITYYGNEKLFYCPIATKSYEEGARNPFAAWKGERKKRGSYGVNDWCGDIEQIADSRGYESAAWATAD